MIVINGDFLCRNLTGVERFAYELTIRLDSLLCDGIAEIYLPANAKNVPALKHIYSVRSDEDCKIFPLWEHGAFRRYVKKRKAVPLDFSNVMPLGCSGIVFIHDIYAKLYPKDFNGKKDRVINCYMKLMYRHIAHHARLLLTVSEFSKKQIADTYRIPPEKIHVVPNGWEHFESVEADDSIFARFPELKKGEFYFTLGSLSRRKNLKWISDYAARHTDERFAISGKMLSGLVPPELEALKNLPNVTLLGYVSDGEVKALMRACKAFVFPSYYEGFGIPPLEALSCGAKIVVSRAASLPEIYGESAYYIDPDNSDVNLGEILGGSVKSADSVLKKYTYENAANMLYALLKKDFL